MNAFVLIARFTKTTGSLGGTSKIRILENGVVFITYVCVYIYLYTYEHIRNLVYVIRSLRRIAKISKRWKNWLHFSMCDEHAAKQQTKQAASQCNHKALLFGQRG